MANLYKLLLGLAGMVIVLGLVVGGMNAREDSPPLSHIEEFYSDYNFVSSLTTSGERIRLAAGLKTYTLPKGMDSERLREVFKRMIRVSQRIHVVDPGMLAPQERSWDPLKQLFRSEFFDVKSMRTSKDSVAVTVTTHAVEPEQVMRFIQEYENPPKGWEFPPMNQLLSRVGQEVIRSQEIHLWQAKFGHWMKLDSHFTFLNEKRLP
ncbi:MAG: hypothetical protein WBB73_08820 [Candidatus Aminicenantaceae bacterium]